MSSHSFIQYMHKKDLLLNNLQWLICHKTKPIQSQVDPSPPWSVDICNPLRDIMNKFLSWTKVNTSLLDVQNQILVLAQLAGAIGYTDWISIVG